MKTYQYSSLFFWTVALVAALFVLAGSVIAGKLLGSALLAKQLGSGQAPELSSVAPPEVVGGQRYKVAVP